MAGLIQLVTHGVQNRTLFGDLNDTNNRNCSQEYINIPFNREVGFNKICESTIPPNADSIQSISLRLRMAALPDGWRYKQCWTNFLIKRIEIEIGGSKIWEATGDWLKMKELIFKNENKELTFDYDADTRTNLSRQEHEVIVEPINLKELLCNEIGISLIMLAFHEVRVKVDFRSLQDCIEPSFPMPPIINENQYMLEGHLIGMYTYYDTDERRGFVNNEQGRNGYITKHNNTHSGIISKHNRFIRINGYHICSAAYIHITDMYGNEIPRQVVKAIKVETNGRYRHNLRGFQSRHQMRNKMPHPTKPNNESQNLYYISYWPGRTNQRGAEQGLNLSCVDIYSFEIEFEDWVLNNIEYKIHINHRSQNIIRYMNGMAGLLFEYGGNGVMNIQDHPIREVIAPVAAAPVAAAPVAAAPVALVFPNTEQLIQVYNDDICMISHSPFENGELVDQCNQCKKVFTTAMLQQWLSTRNRHQHKCIHCSCAYNTDTFKRGKAHIVAILDRNIEVQPLIQPA
jgi:hypothetical protein